MKPEKNLPDTEKKLPEGIEIVDLNLEDGASIFFAPTGEQWRISTNQDGQVVFERLP